MRSSELEQRPSSPQVSAGRLSSPTRKSEQPNCSSGVWAVIEASFFQLDPESGSHTFPQSRRGRRRKRSRRNRRKGRII